METYYCTKCGRILRYCGVTKGPCHTTQYTTIGAGLGSLFGFGVGTAVGAAIGNQIGNWVDNNNKYHKWHCSCCNEDFYSKA